MSRPYNFFQTSEFGITGSGIVAAYKGNFSGFYTPIGQFDTPKGFIVSLGDNESTYGDVKIQISGAQSSFNPDKVGVSNAISGAFFPLITESGNFYSSFTGNVPKGNIDASTSEIKVTGAVSSGNIDSNVYSLGITGNINPFLLEKPIFSIYFSGNVSSGLMDQNYYAVGISGNIVKFNKDYVSFNTDLDYFTWEKGSVLTEISATQVQVLDYGLDFICWSLGGC